MNKTCSLDECSNLTSNPKFCSISCATRHQHRDKVSAVYFKVCKNCDKQFCVSNVSKRNIFCSKSCSARFNNPKTKKKHGTYVKGHPCKNCGRPVDNKYAKYCSSTCDLTWRRAEKIRQWLSGEWNPSSETGVPSVIRNYLLEQAEYRCTSSDCCVAGGWGVLHSVTGRVPLTVDHIDGNAFNNSPSNLRILCPNCHSLTSTYGRLNAGKGRTYRYKTKP